VTVDVFRDQGRSKSPRLVRVPGVKKSNFVTFLIIQDRQIDGTGDVIDLELGR
jgi:hypothetical protein